MQIHYLVLSHCFKVKTKDHHFAKQVTFQPSLYYLRFFTSKKKKDLKSFPHALFISQFKLNKKTIILTLVKKEKKTKVGIILQQYPQNKDCLSSLTELARSIDTHLC